MLEIIEFRRPTESGKNLYITSVPSEVGENELTVNWQFGFVCAEGSLVEIKVASRPDRLTSLYDTIHIQVFFL